MLQFMDGISPWWWLALALALGAIEMTTLSFFLIWHAGAAVLVALLLVLVPGLSGLWQVAVFALLGIALTYGGRMAMRRFGDGGTTHPDLNSRAQQMVGRSAEIISVDGPGGQVRVDGMPWRAEWRLAEPAAGAHRPHPPRPGGRGRVVGTDGNRLFVEPQ